MKNKKIIAIISMLAITFAIFANTAIGMRLSPREKLMQEELTEITTFDEGLAGWKYFSLPFGESVSVDDLRLTHDGVTMDIQKAINQGIIFNSLRVFDKDMNNWVITTVCEPGKAHMVYVRISDDVTLSAVGTFENGYESVLLGQGWNYFGVSIQSPIQASQLKVSCKELGFEGLSIEEADGLLVSKYMYHATNTDSPAYELVDLDNDLIIPGDVYLIFSHVDDVEISFAPIFR